MTVTTKTIGAAAFVQPAGTLGAGASLGNLDAAVGRCLLSSVGAIVVDMSRVTTLDCIGIGELLQLRARVQAAGRVFGLINVEGRQRAMLEMARLSALLGIRDAREFMPADHFSGRAAGQLGASHRIGLALV